MGTSAAMAARTGATGTEAADRVMPLASGPPPSRVVISEVRPTVEGGRYPAKRVQGDHVEISAVVCADGHDELGVRALHRQSGRGWAAMQMEREVNDRWSTSVCVRDLGMHEFMIEAWIDDAATWESRIERKRAAGMDTHLDEAESARLVVPTIHHVRSEVHQLLVDRPLAGFSAWYELFPRSTVDGTVRHATLRDTVGRLDHVADLGFDIVYLPPIHPIGRTARKGPDNALEAGPHDVGSPWAIGAPEGGHTAVHPSLGTDADVALLVREAAARGLEVALDLAFQCSPDHPWINEHPEWFAFRSDGTVAYAENPPKQYQDIIPFHFDTEAWPQLWEALADVVRHWRGLGVRVFRVDNPHTKPFPFWEWLIGEMRREDPGLIFLAEAFARPAVMTQLAKVGFTQSYTHFPWQHAPWQLEQYSTMLTATENVEHLRSNAWPATPDILTHELQQGIRPVFVERLVLAATLSACYGVYGPAYELMESVARPGAEEYARNEKYELRSWDLDAPGSLRDEIRRINTIRRTHRALHHDRGLHFHHVDNDRLLVYSKTAPARERSISADVHDDPVMVVVNTDHWNTQGGTVRIDRAALGAMGWDHIEAHDLWGAGETYRWEGDHAFVRLDPSVSPVHVLRLRPARADDEVDRLP